MQPIEIARRMAELGQKEDAQRAYSLALQEDTATAAERFEAASYIFFSQGDYKVAYTTFVALYNEGKYQEELLNLMTQAFYLPNAEELRKQYQKNCKLLSQYPYLFRKDFLPFEQLPIQFFPFDDKGFIPYFKNETRFGTYIDFSFPVIDRYFFKDLENPILAKDVFSQYQLEYLRDNVRKSEWVGRENHIYLYYTSWEHFCSYLTCLSFQKLLGDKKFIFLVEDEITQYPIDFKARFGIDYTKFTPRPVGIREVHRLIWHTQLSSHNGGDFFNEIFYGHPNLLIIDSIMFESIQKIIQDMRESLRQPAASKHPVLRKLLELKHPSDKDCLVAFFLYEKKYGRRPDPKARITPALFFQPHFGNILYDAKVVNVKKGWTTLSSKQFDEICSSPIFQGFRYIKTFTPMRRITTSFAATTRFMVDRPNWTEEEKRDGSHGVLPDLINLRILNRSFMVDPWNRLYQDSVLVRFEDGKLNPKATFTALAEFLDLPYTESMTYCSDVNGLNPVFPGKAGGFDLKPVYRTYDEYAGLAEREYLEFFFRDAYAFYGYGFQYYQGEPVDEEWIQNKIDHFTISDGFITRSWEAVLRNNMKIENIDAELQDVAEQFSGDIALAVSKILEKFKADRFALAQYLLRGLKFVNAQGQPLQMMKPLKLDPALLEQPLYR